MCGTRRAVREEFRGKTQKTGFQEKGFDYSNIGLSGRKKISVARLTRLQIMPLLKPVLCIFFVRFLVFPIINFLFRIRV